LIRSPGIVGPPHFVAGAATGPATQ